MQISRPNRIARTYTQSLVAEPADVFPLLCPVREADWIEGWDATSVLSDSGIAERDCVFTTRSEDGEAVWYITQHSAEAGTVQMLKITPGVTACKLDITLSASGEGTAAQVTYTHTSLGPRGDEFLKGFTQQHYVRFMQEWESRLNHYLLTGEMLSATE